MPINSSITYGNDMPKINLQNKTIYSNIFDNNFGKAKYFSGQDAEIYFEDIFVDEVVEIGFEVQQNTMPLFGYNSYIYDDLALGTRLIQGAFTLNFTKASYLYEVINTLKLVKLASSNAHINTSDPGALEDFEENKESVDAIKSYERNPLWNKTFSIILSYGGAKGEVEAPASTMVILDGVQITGCSQQFDISGNPIFETYQFVARDIKYTPILSNSQIEEGYIPDKIDDDIVFENVIYTEKVGKNYEELSQGGISSRAYSNIENIGGRDFIYKETAMGYISMDYRTNIEIKKMYIEPILNLDNYKNSWNKEAISIDYKSPINYLVSNSLRKDIKKASSIVKEFQMNIKIEFEVDNKVMSKDFIVDVSIDNIIEYI